MLGVIFGPAIILLAASFGSSASQKCESAVFSVFTQTSSFEWKSGASLSSSGCNVNEKISILVHGWNDGRTWIEPMIQQLLRYRGGCVILFDYTTCTDTESYLNTLKIWESFSAVLTERLREMEVDGIPPENIFIYGFSLGARIAIDAGINFGYKKIGMIDVCDMAGPGFDGVYKKDPKDAANNVQCIFTSVYAGSLVRDQCHQNWLMGNCGNSQAVAEDRTYLLCYIMDCKGLDPPGSHPYCNNFYLSAFENNFINDNSISNCQNVDAPANLPNDFKMGFMENRKHIQGVFAAPTSRNYPYNGSD